MSSRSLYRLTLDGWRPFNDEAQEFTARCNLGDIAELKETKVRNGQYHRYFFAILKLISENSNPHISPKAALHYAKTAAGCGDFEPTGKGDELRFIPGSIAFHKMDQDDFKAFVQEAIPPVVGRFMVGSAPDDVIKEAMELA